MPRGPNGEKRPADTIGAAVMVAKIAPGEIEEELEEKQVGKVNGGNARAASMTPEERSELARMAARTGRPQFESVTVDILRFVELLWRPGDVREVRIPKYNKYGHTASGYFDSPESLAESAAKWDGKANLYITLNPVNPALMARASNRIADKAETTSADVDVIRRRSLFIDIDPVRPSGISSN